MVGKRLWVAVGNAASIMSGYIAGRYVPHSAPYAAADAIISAHLRGAKIRVITDRTMAANKGALNHELMAAGIPVLTNRRHKIEHNKFAVFDSWRIITGSYNWTRNASAHNSENCMFSDVLADPYWRRFNYLWRMYGGTRAAPR